MIKKLLPAILFFSGYIFGSDEVSTESLPIGLSQEIERGLSRFLNEDFAKLDAQKKQEVTTLLLAAWPQIFNSNFPKMAIKEADQGLLAEEIMQLLAEASCINNYVPIFQGKVSRVGLNRFISGLIYVDHLLVYSNKPKEEQKTDREMIEKEFLTTIKKRLKIDSDKDLQKFCMEFPLLMRELIPGLGF